MRMTSAPWSVAQTTPAITSLSLPVPSAPKTVTGMTLTPANATPAMPMPLFVAAATMPAIAVPWPFGSVMPAEPSRMLVPISSCPSRSG